MNTTKFIGRWQMTNKVAYRDYKLVADLFIKGSFCVIYVLNAALFWRASKTHFIINKMLWLILITNIGCIRHLYLKKKSTTVDQEYLEFLMIFLVNSNVLQSLKPSQRR